MNLTFSTLILFFSINAYSETPNQKIQCKELDFSSYHKAENVKANMLRSNPERIHPNFAGKYLLLRNEFLFDTGWFVADCTTGKFIKEMLSTDHKNPIGNFQANNNRLAISSKDPKNTTPLEFHDFQNEKWMRVEVPTVTTPSTPSSASSTPSSASPTTSSPPPTSIDPLFTQFLTPVTATACKEIDFDSHSRAQNAKKNLKENTPDQTQANFGGHLLLLKGDTIFQTYWLIADCNTGKFINETITGNIEFQKDSRLIKFFSSGNFPTYSIWADEDQQWISLHGNNTIHGKTAKALLDTIPNPDHSSRVRFENIKWQAWGNEFLIKTGKCIIENNKIVCDIEN